MFLLQGQIYRYFTHTVYIWGIAITLAIPAVYDQTNNLSKTGHDCQKGWSIERRLTLNQLLLVF